MSLHSRRWLTFALATAILAAPAASRAAPSVCSVPGSALGTTAQIERERLAIRLLASEPVTAAIARTMALYRGDPRAATPAGAATLRGASRNIALAAIQYVINDDRERPMVLWVTNARHRWCGLTVPASGYGIDNPDNVYRNIPIDGAAAYRIIARVPAQHPVEQHFTVMDAIPGTTDLGKEGGGFVGTLAVDDPSARRGDEVTITVDSKPANGRRDHIQVPPAGKFVLIVRDLLTDWARQRPVALTVERVSPTTGAVAPSEAELAERSGALLDTIAPYWLAYNNRYIYARPANLLPAPRVRPGARGMVTSGHFALDTGQALVITLDPLDARSLGVQLTDPWGVAYEYVDRTSSLNRTQAIANVDGTITYVIAPDDPGVANWLDPSGHRSGIVTVRWQGLPAAADATRAVRGARIIRRQDAAALFSGSKFRMSPSARRHQRADRAATYRVRLH